MSGWFQRSPDPLRKKNLQREHSLEKHKGPIIRHHLHLSPSLSAKDHLSQDGSASSAVIAGGGSRHSPLCATKSTPLTYSPSTSSTTSEKATETKLQKESTSSSSIELEELQKELSRLQEKEASLSQKLTLEREHRVRAEQLVEVERLAFHELKYRLHLEERKHRYDERKEAGKDEEGEVRDLIDGGVDFTDADISEGLTVSYF